MTMHKKHHYRELLSIGFPIIIGQLGTIILGFADTLMIERGGVKIGIVGMTNDDSYAVSSPGNLKISDAVEASRNESAINDDVTFIEKFTQFIDRTISWTTSR